MRTIDGESPFAACPILLVMESNAASVGNRGYVASWWGDGLPRLRPDWPVLATSVKKYCHEQPIDNLWIRFLLKI